MKMLKSTILGIVGGGKIAKGLIKLCLKRAIAPVVLLRDKKKAKELENEIIDYQKQKLAGGSLLIPIITSDRRKLGNCNLIIEAIDEDFGEKVRLYRQLKQIMGKTAVVATTTSSLSINKLAAAAGVAERFVGLHFFNPPHYIEFVEVIPSKRISANFLKRATDFLKLINYDYTILPDTKGFVANKLLFSMLLGAVELRVRNKIDESIIDSVVKKSLKHPMGPFELLNFIGIDTANRIFCNLFSGEKLSVWKRYYETLNR